MTTRAGNTWIDAQFTDARNVGATAEFLAGDYKDEAVLDTQLAAANAGYYTAARLATLSINDKIFALRSAVDAAGFMPSGTLSGDPVLLEAPVPLAAPAAKKKTK